MGSHLLPPRLPHCMLRHAPMAAKLFIQNGVELVGVCACRNSCSGSSSLNNHLILQILILTIRGRQRGILFTQCSLYYLILPTIYFTLSIKNEKFRHTAFL